MGSTILHCSRAWPGLGHSTGAYNPSYTPGPLAEDHQHHGGDGGRPGGGRLGGPGRQGLPPGDTTHDPLFNFPEVESLAEEMEKMKESQTTAAGEM